jgi:small conductance mechanosensitive channel
VKAVAVLVESLDALSIRYSTSSNILAVYERFRGLVPLLRRSLEYVIYIFVATLVLLQVEAVAQLAIYGPRIVQVIGIFFLSRVVVEFFEYLVDRSMMKSDKVEGVDLQRQLTLVPLIKSVLRYLIYFGAFVLMLGALGLNPGPVLAGAGLVGLVVGLGAQPLINDVVSGFFILFENLFLVGDYIETGSARGVVEAIDIRTTRIRDPDGQQHILRNGQLNEIINFSKKFTFAVVEVGVAYGSNLDEVYEVLREVGAKLMAQNSDVLEETEVQGLEAFGASELMIRTVTRVKPGRHAQVAREFRYLVKEYFDRHNIEIPFPQQVVTLQSKGEETRAEA